MSDTRQYDTVISRGVQIGLDYKQIHFIAMGDVASNEKTQEIIFWSNLYNGKLISHDTLTDIIDLITE